MSIKVAIVDDNSFLIKAVAEKLSFFDNLKLKITALNGSQLLEQLSEDANLDLILMDIEMPVLSGIETTEIVKKKYPQIKIVMLTVFDNDEHIFNPQDLYDGILDTLNGGAAMNPSIALKTLKLLREPLTIENKNDQADIKLTDREVQVLEQLSKGLSYNAIASNLILSVGTIIKHIENIYRKLQVHNKIEAVQKAKRNKLI